MRTSIEIDDQLMRPAMRSSGAPTKRVAVDSQDAVTETAWRRAAELDDQ